MRNITIREKMAYETIAIMEEKLNRLTKERGGLYAKIGFLLKSLELMFEENNTPLDPDDVSVIFEIRKFYDEKVVEAQNVLSPHITTKE